MMEMRREVRGNGNRVGEGSGADGEREEGRVGSCKGGCIDHLPLRLYF